MRKRINQNLILLSLFAIVALTISITLIYNNLFRQRVMTDLKLNAELLKSTHFFELEVIDVDDLNIRTDGDDLRITWINSDGSVLYDNDNDANQLDNHLNRKEIQDAFEKGSGESIRDSDTMNMNTYYYAILLDNGTVLRVATDAGNITSVFLSAAPLILSIVLVVIILCVVMSQFLTKQLIEPINDMAENLDQHDIQPPYSELQPFSQKIHNQYEDIKKAAKSREEFTASVSHELKTPLTSIQGYAELIELDKDSKDNQKHFAKEITKNSNRLLTLIDDIIYLSELDQESELQNVEKIDLYQLANQCVESLSVTATQKEIELKVEGENAYIYGNREMIYQVLENLIQNGIRYNQEKGQVIITIDQEEDSVLLKVKDDGIGIPKEDQEHVFERFYRVDKSRSKATGGTGLGLAIVKHIAEIHGAKITLNSELGKGTEIIVEFHQKEIPLK